MWSLPDIKILNARAVAEATKLKREAKRKKKPGCQVGGCTEQAIYSDFWFDIFSPDPKGVVHTCEEHNTTDDPDFFFCESCRRIVVDHYTWERYQVQVGQETLCLTCAAARHFAHPDHWINPCEVQEVTLAPGKGLGAVFDRESGVVNLANCRHVLGVEQPPPAGIRFVENAEFDSGNGRQISGRNVLDIIRGLAGCGCSNFPPSCKPCWPGGRLRPAWRSCSASFPARRCKARPARNCRVASII